MSESHGTPSPRGYGEDGKVIDRRFYAALYKNFEDGIYHLGIRVTVRPGLTGVQLSLGLVTLSVGFRDDSPLEAPLPHASG